MKPGKTTVADYLQRWLSDYAMPNLSPRTFEGYEHVIKRYIIPELGNQILVNLKPEHLQHFYSTELNTGLSAQTVGYTPKDTPGKARTFQHTDNP